LAIYRPLTFTQKIEVDNKLTLKLDSTALVDYYNKSYVDNALAGKQPTLNMLTALSAGTITVAGAITAAGFTTTGTATLGSINTDIMYVSTMMQSAGPVRVGSLAGGGVWTDTCKLEAKRKYHLCRNTNSTEYIHQD